MLFLKIGRLVLVFPPRRSSKVGTISVNVDKMIKNKNQKSISYFLKFDFVFYFSLTKSTNEN